MADLTEQQNNILTILENSRFDEVKRFLNALSPHSKTHLFASLGEVKNVVNKKDADTQRYEFNETTFGILKKTNIYGGHIFVTVNEMDNDQGNIRASDRVTLFRAIYIDDDTKQGVRDYPLKPSCRMQTSDGKYHVYWFLKPDRSISRAEYEGVLQTMVNKYGGDKGAKDSARILRVNEFVNLKPKHNGFMAKLDYLPPQDEVVYYEWADIIKAFPPSEVKTTATETGAMFNPDGYERKYALAVKDILLGTALNNSAFTMAIKHAHAALSKKEAFDDIWQYIEISDGRNPDINIARAEINKVIDNAYNTVAKKAQTMPMLLDLDYTGTQAPPINIPLDKDKFTRHDWPPGFVGELAQAIFYWMLFPNSEIAITAAIFICSAMSGRKDSFMDNGLDLVLTILGTTAIGKDTARKVMSIVFDILRQLDAAYLDIDAFKPLSGAYGVKAFLKRYAAAPSVGYIQSEGGINEKSTAGDPEAIKAFFMQNQMQDAYEDITVKEYADGFPTIYGIPLIRMVESTPETYAHMTRNGNNHASGAAGREFKIYVDHRVNGKHTKRVLLPQNIIDGLARLYFEAVRDEDLNFSVTVGKATFVGCSLKSVPMSSRRYFKAVPSVEAYFDATYVEHIVIRNNTPNDKAGDSAWAQHSRLNQKLMRMSLLLARTDQVVYGIEALEVRQQDLDYAKHFADECDRSDKANTDVYEDSEQALTKAIYELALRLFKKPNKEFSRLHGKDKIKEHHFRTCTILNTTNKASKIAKEMALNNKYDRSAGDFVQKALKHGERDGYWEVYPSATAAVKEAQYLIVNIGKNLK